VKLVIGVLTIQSSYARNIEEAATDVPDTIQFALSSAGNWRVRTYAMDHDIHTYDLGGPAYAQRLDERFAVDHIKKHYSDVTASVSVFTFRDPSDEPVVQSVLAEHGLRGTLEVSSGGLAFYNPDGASYRTQSTPSDD
jgi:hypothetical protein